MTTVVVIDGLEPSALEIERGASVLRAGGLVAFPTETVYGLGALVSDRGALRRVFEAKGRPPTDPLIVHVAAAADASALVETWSPVAEILAQRFWPGPLTLVLPRSDRVPDEVTASGPSVGVRVPAHPVALALIAAAGGPVAAPSANRFGRVSPTEAAHVLEELDGRIDLILDGGPTPLGVESTVVDLCGAIPRVLRHGGVTVEDLESLIGPIDAPERLVATDGEASSAPGQLLVHYAPLTPVVLVEGEASVVDRLLAELATVGIRSADVELDRSDEVAAAALYRSLRSADALGVDLLLVRARSGVGLGRAINDRLFRAARGIVVTDRGADTIGRLVALVGR